MSPFLLPLSIFFFFLDFSGTCRTRTASGHCFTISTVFQSHINCSPLPSMATGDDFPVFRNDRIQFSIQYDVYISILSNARRWFIPWQECWLYYDVLVWRCIDDRKFYSFCSMLNCDLIRNFSFLFQFFAFFVNLLFLGQAFTIMLVYVWSRRNPFIRMNFFGILNFLAPYLPWALLGFSVILGNAIWVDLMGMAVGHIYYFLEDVFPKQQGGFRILKTPLFLYAWDWFLLRSAYF